MNDAEVWLKNLAEEADWLAEHAKEWAADFDLAALASALVTLKGATAVLSNVRKSIESELAARMESNEVMVDGVGLLERRYSTKRKDWDHQAIGSKILAEAPKLCMLDRTSGEVEDTSEAVVRILLDAAGISYWKLTPLKEMGIDPDRYCTVGDSEVSVSIRGSR